MVIKLERRNKRTKEGREEEKEVGGNEVGK